MELNVDLSSEQHFSLLNYWKVFSTRIQAGSVRDAKLAAQELVTVPWWN